MAEARYDGIAEWYEREFATSDFAHVPRDAALRLLGPGPGRLLDVGCGTGAHTAAFAERGWTVVGTDVSEQMLGYARERGVEVVRADAAALPFPDASFDAVVSVWTHTDVDNFAALVGEAGRVLAPAGRLVYVGAHPCFVGPHSRFAHAVGVPELHPGYRATGRYDRAPGISPTGLRIKVGAVHLTLGQLLGTFVHAGFAIERFEELELESREYPYTIALRCRR
jgi:SAM-dependent methyltransferase